MGNIVLVACWLLTFALLAAPAARGADPRPDASAAAPDPERGAQAAKDAGDREAARGNYSAAAAHYADALSRARDRFTTDERTGMATAMSWGGRMDEAIRELRFVLAADPGNAKARVQLARVLSWTGRTDAAVEEADEVLRESPAHVDALLAKADALRYKGNNASAAAIYREVLEREDNFQARLGLAYLDLSAGDVAAAREGRALLKPRYPYQENARKELDAAIARASAPSASAGFSYYKDTDDNLLRRYSASAGVFASGWKLGLDYRHTDARDLSRDARADDLSLSAYYRVSRRAGIGAGVGGTRLDDGDSRDIVVGHVRADAAVAAGTISVAASRSAFPDTAQLIENGIRFTSLSASAGYPLPRNFALATSYSFRDYSDDNSSHDAQGSLKHSLRIPGPSVGVGYRIRYLDFRRESGGGYFDPSDFLSHQMFVTFYYGKGRFYTYLEPYFGYLAFKRSGGETDGWFGGGNGVVGVKLSGKVTLEFTGEGGNYPGATAAGFEYYLAGLRVNASF